MCLDQRATRSSKSCLRSLARWSSATYWKNSPSCTWTTRTTPRRPSRASTTRCGRAPASASSSPPPRQTRASRRSNTKAQATYRVGFAAAAATTDMAETIVVRRVATVTRRPLEALETPSTTAGTAAAWPHTARGQTDSAAQTLPQCGTFATVTCRP